MEKIPFYKNTKDNTHCFQACLKSILKFYFPQKNYSFSYLDKVTAHKKGKWTWASAGLIFLAKTGLKVINIENFSYKKFAKLGEKYLKDIWPDEIFQTQKKFSNIKKEQIFAKKLLKEKKIQLEERYATLKDIRNLFKKKYILLCNINPYILKNKKGYSSHSVLITDITKNTIRFHDPGLPPFKNRKVSLKKFLKAMRYPSKESASIIAVKKAK